MAHHFAGSLKALDKLVNLFHRRSRTAGDTRAARAVEDRDILTLGGRHRTDDSLDAVNLALVEVVDLLAQLGSTRDHAEHLLHGPQLLNLLELAEEVGEGQLAGQDLGGDLFSLLSVHLLLGLLDEGEDVTHVEDAPGHTIRVEALEVIEPLARGSEENRSAGHAAHRQGGTASCVAVQLGQDHAGKSDAIAECHRRRHRVLTNHGVQDEHDLVRVDGIANRNRLVHHLLVDAEAAGGIDDNDVDAALAGELNTAACNLDGVAHTVAGFGSPHLDAGALADDLKLLDGVRALEVGRHEEDGLAFLTQPLAELSGQGGLTGTLKAGEHKDGGTGLREGQFAGGAAQDLNKFVVDDGDDLLAGVESLGAGRTVGLLANLGGELTDNGKSDIRFDEGAADIGNRLIDVGLGQDPATAQGAEGLGQAV